MRTKKTWHDEHQEGLSISQKIADKVANGMGSWGFIIIQTLLVAIWMILNVVGWSLHWMSILSSSSISSSLPRQPMQPLSS